MKCSQSGMQNKQNKNVVPCSRGARNQNRCSRETLAAATRRNAMLWWIETAPLPLKGVFHCFQRWLLPNLQRFSALNCRCKHPPPINLTCTSILQVDSILETGGSLNPERLKVTNGYIILIQTQAQGISPQQQSTFAHPWDYRCIFWLFSYAFNSSLIRQNLTDGAFHFHFSPHARKIFILMADYIEEQRWG